MFNANKFEATAFSPRIGEIKVPALSTFFGEGEDPVWKVRGVTGEEFAKANEAVDRSKNLSALVSVLERSTGLEEKTEAIREALGLGDKVTGDLAKRMELFVAGSVDPEATIGLAVKMAGSFPVEFWLITNEITKLTGLGAVFEGK